MLPGVVTKWAEAWAARRAELVRRNRTEDEDLDRITRTLEALLWAAGRAGAKADFFATVVEARPDDPLYRPIRLATLHALTWRTIADDEAGEQKERA